MMPWPMTRQTIRRFAAAAVLLLVTVVALINRFPYRETAPISRAFWSADGTPRTAVVGAGETLSYSLTNAVEIGGRQDGVTIVVGDDQSSQSTGAGRTAVLVEGVSRMIVAANLAPGEHGTVSLPQRAIATTDVDPSVVSIRVFDSKGNHLEEPHVDPATGRRFVIVFVLGQMKLHGIQMLDAAGRVVSTQSAGT
jgi:hypothetical protein